MASTVQIALATMLAVVVLVLIWLLQPILTPFLVGLAIAYLGDPLVDRMEAYRVNRTVAVAVVFVVFVALIALGLLVLIPLLMREVSALVRDIPYFIEWLQQTTSPVLVQYFGVDPFDIGVESLRVRLAENWQQAGGLASRILSEVTASGVALMTWVANLALIPVVVFYLLRDWDRLVQTLRSLLPRDVEPTAVRLAGQCDEVLSAFLRGQLLIMLLLGCIYATGLYIVGLELAVLIGMLAGLASIVPYLGFIVGILAAGIAAIFQFQDAAHVVYIAIVFGIGQVLEGTVLTPLLVGDRIGLHPVAVIFAVLAGGQLFGFVGILLALPVAAVIMVFVRYAHETYRASEYYASAEGGGGSDDLPPA